MTDVSAQCASLYDRLIWYTSQVSFHLISVEHFNLFEHCALWLVHRAPDKIMHPDLAKSLKTVWRSFKHDRLTFSVIFGTNKAMARYHTLQANARVRQ